ncbi:hypothetical protein HK100_007767 [Physocladia obscura]|uniref:Protein kinase domain-containing protein n=1 Tax=Physocladia obscura TaxID=109957 RepID=A0AAD5T694_9FUNG|nr:hypothetical protein HK100_007767 [Physocladia obscura]
MRDETALGQSSVLRKRLEIAKYISDQIAIAFETIDTNSTNVGTIINQDLTNAISLDISEFDKGTDNAGFFEYPWKPGVCTLKIAEEADILFSNITARTADGFFEAISVKIHFIGRIPSESRLIAKSRSQSLHFNSFKHQIVKELATGLAHMHSLGFSHGNIKLENTGIGADGFAKLIDFGAETLNRSMSQENELLWKSSKISNVFAADALSFAITAFEILSGRPAIYPLKKSNSGNVIYDKIKTDFDFNFIDPTLRKILIECWQSTPSADYSVMKIWGKLKNSQENILPIEIGPESVYMRNFLSVKSIDGNEDVFYT